MPVPLLILGDSPTAPTGLGRIARELALRIHQNMSDVFEVATFGYGGTTSRKLPFQQYPMTTQTNYVAPELPAVWNDFCGDREGVILTIWNASWLWWLADCEKLPDSCLREFLRAKPFKRWAYVPVDGDGPNGTLGEGMGKILAAFERVLAYTQYGAAVIDRTVAPYPNHNQQRPCEHLPHGLDTSVFYPRDRDEARRTFVQRILGLNPGPLQPNLFMVGVVATNTARKDWYLAFETCAELLKRGKHVGLWVHTDAYKKCWDLEALAEEFGMTGRVFYSNHHLSDDEMAWGYSACDVTLGIGSGEGWGYPLAEALACGVSVVHGAYAGGAEIVPKAFQVDPVVLRGDGLYGIRRPVFKASDWADVAEKGSAHGLSLMSPRLDWNNAWPLWEEWLKAGVQ